MAKLKPGAMQAYHNPNITADDLGKMLSDPHYTSAELGLIWHHPLAPQISPKCFNDAVNHTTDPERLMILAIGASKMVRNGEEPFAPLTAHMLLHHAPLSFIKPLVERITDRARIHPETVRSMMDSPERAPFFADALVDPEIGFSYQLYPYVDEHRLTTLLRRDHYKDNYNVYQEVLDEAHRLGKRGHIAAIIREIFSDAHDLGHLRYKFLPFVPTDQVEHCFKREDDEDAVLDALEKGKPYHPDDYNNFVAAVYRRKMETGYDNTNPEQIHRYMFDHLHPETLVATFDDEDEEKYQSIVLEHLERLTAEGKIMRRDAIVKAVVDAGQLVNYNWIVALIYTPVENVIRLLPDWPHSAIITDDQQDLRKKQILDAICADPELIKKHTDSICLYGSDEHLRHLSGREINLSDLSNMIPRVAMDQFRPFLQHCSIVDLAELALMARINRDPKAVDLQQLANERLAALPDADRLHAQQAIHVMRTRYDSPHQIAAIIDLETEHPITPAINLTHTYFDRVLHHPDSKYTLLHQAALPPSIRNTFLNKARQKLVDYIHHLRNHHRLTNVETGDVMSVKWMQRAFGQKMWDDNIVALISSFHSGNDPKHAYNALRKLASSEDAHAKAEAAAKKWKARTGSLTINVMAEEEDKPRAAKHGRSPAISPEKVKRSRESGQLTP